MIMKYWKKILGVAIFISLLVGVACQILLQTPPHQEETPINDVVFVGKSKNLKNAKIQMFNINGNKFRETNLSENGRLEEIPSHNLYLKINQKETDDGL